MIWILAALAAAAAAFQLLAVVAGISFLRGRQSPPGYAPPVSVLKPVHGLDPNFYQALRSHALQDYPEFEILFGLNDPADPAKPHIERLMAEFPAVPMRVVLSRRRALNGKAGVLADLAAVARHSILVVNDSDIQVPPGYLRRVVEPLADPAIGLVTCLYRGDGSGLAGRLEALSIATDFAPGVLVARLLGVSEFAMGSTLAFRAADLQRVGGFEAIADYLADDYQLGKRLGQLGLKVVIARPVVTTHLPNKGWRQAWHHQVRWARTIRVSRCGGYLGMPLTMATLWALALAAWGHLWAAAGLFALRMMAALVTAAGVLGARLTCTDLLLVPVRDLWGVAIWAAGLAGNTVVWRGQRLRITGDGRIAGVETADAQD